MGTADASGLPLARADLTASFAVQYATLLQRAFNDVRRNPMRGKAPVFQAIFSALIITLIWWDVGNDQNSVQDRAGVIFFLAANGLMQNVMGVLTTFANERAAVDVRFHIIPLLPTLPFEVPHSAHVHFPFPMFLPFAQAQPVHSLFNNLILHYRKI